MNIDKLNDKKISILNLTIGNLSDILVNNGFEKYRAKQVLNWIYKSLTFSFEDMSNLPKKLRIFLSEQFNILSVKEIKTLNSKDGNTTKFLLSLNDNYKIECVLIGNEKRHTLCLSSQVGCPLDCKFCATGKMGFLRNLDTSEIISQFLHVKSITGNIDNVVFMGMGEPLLNYDNVMLAIKLLNDKNYLNFGIRRIAISTAGIIKGIEKLMEDSSPTTDNTNTKTQNTLMPRLAVSLNSAIEKIRSDIMPINKTNPLKKLVDALKKYQEKTGKRFTFEYVLIKDLNTNKENADAIIELSKELRFNLNIIPYNPVLSFEFETPSGKEIENFINYFNGSGIEIVRRYKKGNDISAACGQLITQI